MLPVLKERGITLKEYSYHPERRMTIHEPEVIEVTLENRFGETLRVETYCTGRDHVLRPDEYIQLVIDRYYEKEEDWFHRTWQWQKWGTPVHWLKPGFARQRATNEFDYYNYVPGWYDHMVRQPRQRFRAKFEDFVRTA